MKKFFVAVVLMLTLIFCVMPVFAAQNATISLSASNTTVYAGDTFTVTVKSTSVRYCIVGGYMFDFDTDVFEYVAGSALVTGFSSSGISTANDYIAGYFMNGNATVTGNLFRITLRVKDNAALGNHTISGTPSLKTEANGVQELVNCSSAGVTVTIACNHNMQPTTAAVAPGCETTGKTAVLTCANGCGLSEGGAEIPALGHDMQETAVAVAPTCTTAGKTAVKTCANGCGLSEGGDEIPATGHDMKETEAAVAPGCETTGKTAVMTCANGCGTTEGGDEIPATGHDMKETEAAVAPGCETTGKTAVMTCANGCGLSEGGEVIDATGHNYVDGTCSCGATLVCTHEPNEAVIENKVDSTLETVGSYDEVIYCKLCGVELNRVKKDALLNPWANTSMKMSSMLCLQLNINVTTTGFKEPLDFTKSGYYVVVTRFDENGIGHETRITSDMWEVNTKMRVRVPYSNWNPTQMCDTLEYVLYNDKDEQISEVYRTSVRTAIMKDIQSQVDKGITKPELVTLLIDMLNYGAAAQQTYGGNQGDYANSLLDPELKAQYETKEAVYGDPCDNSSVAFLQTTAMELTTRILFRMNLWKDEFGCSLEELKVDVSYYNYAGDLQTKTVSGKEFQPHTNLNGKARCKFVLDWVDVPDCASSVTLVFKDGEGNILGTINESILSTLGYFAGKNPTNVVYPALAKFVNSSRVYFTSLLSQ